MKTDRDLEFLTRCSNSDLKELCDILVFDDHGRYRLTEGLSSSDDYLRNYPDNMQGMVDAISEELLRFGSNTLVTYAHHGRPDSYETIVRRVCKIMRVSIAEDDDSIVMERHLLENVCEATLRNMSEEELREIASEVAPFDKNLSRPALLTALIIAIKKCPKVFAKVVRTAITHIMTLIGGRALAINGGKAAQVLIGFSVGPAAWALTTCWALWDLASPAYRVIIPAVLKIAAMRYITAPRIEDRRVA